MTRVHPRTPRRFPSPRPVSGEMSRLDDYIAVVEAAWNLELDEASWLLGLLGALLPALDRGLGVLAWTYRVAPGEAPRVDCGSIALVGCSPELREVLSGSTSRVALEDALRVYLLSGTAAPFAQALGVRSLPEHSCFQGLAAFGVHDVACVRARNPDLTGCLFCAPHDGSLRESAGGTEALAYLMAHVAAAHRLRATLRAGPGAGVGAAVVDAVFDPDGSVHDAAAAARSGLPVERLSVAVARRTRSRGALRREDPPAALARWRPLVQARWSLVDAREQGREVVLARRNAPEVRAFGTLAGTEAAVAVWAALGQPNTLIAYEVGLSHARVSEILRSAMQRAGAGARADLVRTLRLALISSGVWSP